MKTHLLTRIVFAMIFVGQLLAGVNLPEHYEYVFPAPDAQYVSPSSTIILRLTSMSPRSIKNLDSCINLEGTHSGELEGSTIIASDGRTIIFKSDNDFFPGEIVSVSVDPRSDAQDGSPHPPLVYEFSVLSTELEQVRQIEGPPVSLAKPIRVQQAAQARIMPNGVSVPGDFPHVNVTEKNNPSADYIFLSNWGPPNYTAIYDTSGNPIWYTKTWDQRRDFKLQPNGWLTMLVRDGYGGYGDGYIALDQNYEWVKTFRTSNGYYTDEHELQVLPDSGYFLIGRRETEVDMSAYVAGGQTNAIVRETCIQEFTADDQLVFIWRAWDHFDIRDLDIEDLTRTYIRFPHMNAIDIDDDGNILLSSRHLSEITKINRQSGEIMWRLSGLPGSSNNDFQFLNDPLFGTRNQHSIRSLGNNHYTIFDNGNLHDPPLSRAVEYELDTLLMTATKVWEFQNDQPGTNSYYMGNAQRLSNGNTHINWAVGNSMPVVSEITPDGSKALEMRYANGYHCYRSFRFPWSGKSLSPSLMLEILPDKPLLLFNQFGDSEVDYYRIYGDTVSQPTSLLDTSRSTMKSMEGLLGGKHYYFRVTAVNKDGVEGNTSNEVEFETMDLRPGVNLINNGDFSSGLDGWITEITGSASGSMQIENGVNHISIANGGSNVFEVQLRQIGIPLIQGQNYTFKFTAWADQPRVAEIKVGQDVSPYTNYSRIGYTSIGTIAHQFSYAFEMNESTDNNARVVFNAGTSSHDLYIDDVSLVMDAPAGVDSGLPETPSCTLFPNYPNPFNANTRIQYLLSEAHNITLKIYNIQGREVALVENKIQSAGMHHVQVNLSNFQSGVYFYRLEAKPLAGSQTFNETKKMIILK